MNAMTNTLDSMKDAITLGGALGSYSIGLHLTLLVVLVVMMAMMLAGIVWMRKQSTQLLVVCIQDLIFGVVCGLLIFTALGMPFFLGRAFWRACTWNAAVA